MSSQAAYIGKKIIFIIIIYFTLIPIRLLVILVSLLQLAFSLFKGQPHHALVTLSSFLSQYIASCMNYVLFLTNTLPYPLNKISS